MDEGIRFLDIIFFAMVAAFILLRLRNVLGRRTGHERRPSELLRRSQESPEDNVIPLPDRSEAEADAESAREADSPAAAGLAQIRMSDPHFQVDSFLSGARAAYEMVISAFAAGDTETLRPFLNDDVYDDFAGAIRERQEQDQILESTLVSINSADIIDARMRRRDAEITVSFVSEIINVLRDAAGEVIEGDPPAVREVTDLWTFYRDTRSDDPNWTLIETRSAN